VTRPRIRLAAGLAVVAVLSGCTGASPVTPDGAAPADPDDVLAVDTDLAPCPEQPAAATAGGGALPALAFDCVGGGSLDLARAPGAPTVLNLWGSWCTPCRDELPVLQEFADVAGDRVRVLGVISRDGVPQADSFAADAGVTFPSAFDGEGELMTELGLNALPYTAFLDADGRLVHSELGPVDSVDELRGLVAAHLGVQL
jgi:cytochrome c biogenesis protein CcmG, thiol:disulfide interchange protein DsbE